MDIVDNKHKPYWRNIKVQSRITLFMSWMNNVALKLRADFNAVHVDPYMDIDNPDMWDNEIVLNQDEMFQEYKQSDEYKEKRAALVKKYGPCPK